MIFYDHTRRRRRILRSCFHATWLVGVLLFSTLIWSVYSQTTPVFTEPNTELSDTDIVLTFDDGPHPKYTPAVLDILEEKNVSAAFFFVGAEALEYPDIVRRVHEAGHEIGNHSLTHSPSVHRSKERLRFELQTTNQILERITGVRTQFYRSPFLLDFDKSNQEFIDGNDFPTDSPLHWFAELGYVGVSAYIDPQDWNLTHSGTLVQQVLERTEYGNIILLHDGGSQRSITLEALPFIIDELQARGFRFVSLEELSGIGPTVTPTPTANAIISEHVSIPIFGTLYTKLQPIFVTITAFVLILSILRLLTILILYRVPRRTKPVYFDLPVSVLIPAYNEARNIGASIASIANSTHRKIEIIVIDDGSTDNTACAVADVSNTISVPLRYIRKTNGGKASALNRGLKEADHDIVVCVDGDTIIHPDAITHLVSHFSDPKVGAVAGKITAITDQSPLSWFQDIEYTVSQNIEKIAFNTLFGSIAVIPGAIGAWRVSAVTAAGAYSTDTWVEDQDLTFAIHQHHYKIFYEPHAVAYTEVPTTVRAFIKQRFRWMFGTIQCLWKYKKNFGSPKTPQLGFVIIPYGILFAVLTPLCMPILDGLLVYALITGSAPAIIVAVLAFIVADVIYHGLGFLREPHKFIYLPLIPIQRMFYRAVFSFLILKCIVFALEGTRTSWTKQLRTGSAQALFSKTQQQLILR